MNSSLVELKTVKPQKSSAERTVLDVRTVWESYIAGLLTPKTLLISLSQKVKELDTQRSRAAYKDEIARLLAAHPAYTWSDAADAVEGLIGWLRAHRIVLVDDGESRLFYKRIPWSSTMPYEKDQTESSDDLDKAAGFVADKNPCGVVESSVMQALS